MTTGHGIGWSQRAINQTTLQPIDADRTLTDWVTPARQSTSRVAHRHRPSKPRNCPSGTSPVRYDRPTGTDPSLLRCITSFTRIWNTAVGNIFSDYLRSTTWVVYIKFEFFLTHRSKLMGWLGEPSCVVGQLLLQLFLVCQVKSDFDETW